MDSITSVYTRSVSNQLVRDIAVTLSFAAITIMAARIAIPLWFTPVPITFQVLAALLAGLILGPRLGAVSQLQYLALGLAGFPVFAGGKAGVVALAGPTGGYLIGLVAMAFLAGLAYKAGSRPGRWRASAACLAGIGAIYFFGAVWLAVWMASATGQAPSPASVFATGIAPFILIDLGKAFVCGFVLDSGKTLISRISASKYLNN